MLKNYITPKLLLPLFSLACATQLSAQTCGATGDAVFFEDFGFGNGTDTDHVALPSGTTAYNLFTGNTNIPDGSYAVTTKTDWYNEWEDTTDNSGTPTGRCLVVNADNSAVPSGEFYRNTVSGLCSGTTYVFSAYYINLNTDPVNRDGINISFEIYDAANLTTPLATGNTGSVANVANPQWTEHDLAFTTPVGVTDVVLVLRNNEPSINGNDLAIDDISFSPCNAAALTVTDANGDTGQTVCGGSGSVSLSLTVSGSPTGAGLLWQTSNDLITWTSTSITSVNYNAGSTGDDETFYRVLVAEDPANINNAACRTVSDVYSLQLSNPPTPDINPSTLNICSGAIQEVNYTIDIGTDPSVVLNWYNSSGTLAFIGTNEVPPNLTADTYTLRTEDATGCESSTDVTVDVNVGDAPSLSDEILDLCFGDTLTLEANSDITTGVTYQWTTDATDANGDPVVIATPNADSIEASVAGTYSVEVTNGTCADTKLIVVNAIEVPEIASITSDGVDIVVTMANANTDNFEYSIDGTTFQTLPVFQDVLGGAYTITVRHPSCDTEVEQDFFHLLIPDAFTPNGDGINDVFQVGELSSGGFIRFQCIIFDRYGKILSSTVGDNALWDGTYDGKPMPSDDYWYEIILNEERLHGHITLTR